MGFQDGDGRALRHVHGLCTCTGAPRERASGGGPRPPRSRGEEAPARPSALRLPPGACSSPPTSEHASPAEGPAEGRVPRFLRLGPGPKKKCSRREGNILHLLVRVVIFSNTACTAGGCPLPFSPDPWARRRRPYGGSGRTPYPLHPRPSRCGLGALLTVIRCGKRRLWLPS